jgi:hypothetical protein
MRLFLIFLFIGLHIAVAQVSKPGIGNAGGSGNYSLMYPDESGELAKLQMVDERVTVLLYPGFAVVKGCYHLYNPDTADVYVHSGYPTSSVYDISVSNAKKEIDFNNLHALEVFENGFPISIEQRPNPGRTYYAKNDWYIWENHFPAGDTVHVQVYFIVNTNNARYYEKSGSRRLNAFIYLLESGASWKKPIEKGEIRIELQGGLTLDDIMGLEPQYGFLQNDEKLLWKFEHLSPTLNDNIVLTHKAPEGDFDFEDIIRRKDEYFAEVQQCSRGELDPNNFQPVDFELPVRIANREEEVPVWLLFGGGILGLFLVGFLFRKSILK